MKIKKANHWQPEDAISYWINQASREILKRFEKRLRPQGFGMAYLPVAMALESKSPLNQKQLAEHINIEQPTMAALLKRMERDQIIFRQQDPNDRRAYFFYLTEKGYAHLPEVKNCLTEESERLVQSFSESEKEVLLTLLKKLVGDLLTQHVH
jgi:MarR family transcriptional regulator, transcriptional regulator for hemolysin